MAIYKPTENRALAEILPEERLSNQVVISGTNDSLSAPKGIFFLELLQLEAGKSITIADGDGNIIATGVTSFEQEHSPLRCDKGITITGDVQFGKGFVINAVFAS